MIKRVSRPALAVIQTSGSRAEPGKFADSWRNSASSAPAPDCPAAARACNRFTVAEQVVDRTLFEGVDGVLIVGGDEDDLGARTGFGQRACHFQSGQSGHADVQEHHVRLVFGDGLQRRGAVLALGHDLQFRPHLAQHRRQRGTQQFFVFGDHALKHGSGLLRCRRAE
jgi:hypothetical protein